jgi:hypothetical protein
MSQFKINGALSNPGTLTGAVYANQIHAADAPENSILYYENGEPTSSENLTFDGSSLQLTANNFNITNTTANVPSFINGYVKLNGVVEIDGDFGQDNGNANIAIGPDPYTSATPGPRLLYRTRDMPLYWVDSFLVQNKISTVVFTVGLTGPQGSTGSALDPYFRIDGPYTKDHVRTTTTVMNADINANPVFWPLSATVGGVGSGDGNMVNLPPNSKITAVQVRATGNNTSLARVTVGIFFFPPS